MDENASIVIAGATIAASKTACTLIQKISDATGWIFAPYQIKRTALAKADAARILAEADRQIKAKDAVSRVETEEKINDIHYRASIRHAAEEVKKQANMESVLAQAIPQITDGARPEAVDDDWIVNFFDKCRIVSSAEMQALWAKVLAGEANSPGTYSKRTVNFLQTLEVPDAELFCTLCRFIRNVGGRTIPLIFDTKATDTIYTKHGINLERLAHLADIGLINLNSATGYSITTTDKFLNADYMGQKYQISQGMAATNEVSVGHAMLSQVGRQLASVVPVAAVEGFRDYVIGKWEQGKVMTVSSIP